VSTAERSSSSTEMKEKEDEKEKEKKEVVIEYPILCEIVGNAREMRCGLSSFTSHVM
jgi:hypothetical protein